jgi:hypothetical protein
MVSTVEQQHPVADPKALTAEDKPTATTGERGKCTAGQGLNCGRRCDRRRRTCDNDRRLATWPALRVSGLERLFGKLRSSSEQHPAGALRVDTPR